MLSRLTALRPDGRSAVRAASFAAVAIGVAVCVVTSAAAPLAGADTAAGAHRRLARPTAVGSSAPFAATPSTTASTTADTPAATAPSTSARRAPVDRTVISSLAANGIPSVALNAYRVAAARLASADPSCGIQWPLIAGIGREESDHGRFAGAVLHADGISTPSIVGPALNGRAGNRFIPAPANGLALDGDARYAHALGPMQFIPSTWAIYGLDADGDGRADIFDINDAALATARYLCAAGGDLRTHAGRVRAVFAYNNTSVYVAQVLALAQAYRTGTSITGLPHGNTTGSLPSLGTAGTVPPANPGSPTANKPHKTLAQRKAAQRKKTEQRRRAEHRRAEQRRKHQRRLGGGSPTHPGTTTHAPPPSHGSTHPTPKPTKGRHGGSSSPTPSPTRTSPSPSPTCILVCLP